MMIVSIGTGLAYSPLKAIYKDGRWLLAMAKSVPSELMRGIQVENDINCRTIGRCVHGAALDSEIGHMVYDVPLETNIGGHFLYARYDADVSAEGLEKLGLGKIDAKSLTMDNVGSIDDLKAIGKKSAELQVDLPRQFAPFMPGGQRA